MASGDIIINGVTFTPQDLEQLTNEISNRLKSTSKDPNEYEQATSLEGITSIPVFKQKGDGYQLVRVLTSLLKGTDGREIFLQKTDTHLQWRWDGGGWNNLVELVDLVGAKGSSPEFRTTDQGLEWKYDTESDESWRMFLDFSLFRGEIKKLSDKITENTAAVNTNAAEIGMLTDGLDTLAADMDQMASRKADGAFVEEGFLYLTSKGEVISDGIELPAGGGSGPGGGGGSVLRLRNLGESILGAPKGSAVILHYNFTSVDAEDQSPTGSGTVAYFVNSLRVLTQSVQQGDNSIDISGYLSTGQNEVRIHVTDSYGAGRSIYVRVEVVDLVLRSDFNDSVPYEGDVIFLYTPIGNGSKTIHFVLDGGELDPVVTTVTNRQLSYVLKNLAHGNHALQVYATMELNGVILRSNELYFDIIALGESGTTIISSSFNRTTAEQYEVLNIPYTVYTPGALNSPVVLKANGEVMASLTVDRKAQVWSYRINDYGTLNLELISGEASKKFTLSVAKSSIDASAETENLELWLTAGGRSNNEENPETWNYGTTQARLDGFNYRTNGWVLDDHGVSVLRVAGGASVDIPFRPFAADFKNTGKTIEFEFTTRNIENFEAVLVSCMSGGRGLQITAQEALFASELSSVSTKFKEEEHIRLSFVVENRMKNRLVYIYINGVMSGTVQYAPEDNFAQNPPVNIRIGSPDCTVDIYNIRSYTSDLNQYQILNNYISDLGDITEKLAIFSRNQVTDASGEIVFNQLLDRLPCMLITGTLPTYKGDKQTVAVAYENRADITKSFTAQGVEIDVQGTSSQYYPRKNFKTKFKQGLVMTETGEQLDTYQLTDDAIPVAVFCQKADFAESSGTHNTGMARIVDRVLREMDILTPPQRENSKVRTTVDGFPMAIFHREAEGQPIRFVGKYNFNNDKSTQETYGFDGADECWEFLNNTADRCLFRSADFTESAWLDDFEGRYPDANDNPDNLSKVVSWVVSCQGNPDKFRSECEQHFNLPNLLSYYLISELFAMVDQRAKNMMMASWGNEGQGDYKWYFIFYDNDTVLGINNEGANVFGFGVEAHDPFGSGHVWNGHDSALWQLVEEAYAEELAALYHTMRQTQAVSYDKAIAVLNGEQSDKWCEVVYNMDGQYKYIDPLIDNKNASYLYALQGSRTEHRKWWLRNRLLYIDSKYNAGDFLNDYVTMRIYTPAQWQGVEPNADFDLTLYKDSYLNVKYGSYILSRRAKANQTIRVEAPSDIQFNDTETIIYGVQAVKGIGDLSAKYPGTVDITNAHKLTELIIGSAAEGYQNENLKTVNVGNNTLLRTLDVRNCPKLSEPLDLSGCTNIEEILCEGTSLSTVKLPAAGSLRKLSLPATISNLTLKNQPTLTNEGLIIAGKANISTLVIEHMDNIDTMQLVRDCLTVRPQKLNRLRLVGIDWTDTDLSILAKLYEINGVDENENTVPHAVITGKFRASEAFASEVAAYAQRFPELEITTGKILEDPVTVFEFVSNQQKPLENISFECTHPYTKISDTSYSVKAPTGTVIELLFKSDLHEDVKEEYTVTTARTRRYNATYIPLRTIQVVTNNIVAIPGATVIIDEETYTADADAKVYIRRREGFEVRAFSDDHGGSTFTIPESLTDTFDQLRLYPYYNNVFIVSDDLFLGILPNAVIECNGVKYTTDEQGQAIVRLTQGEHFFKAYYKDNEVYNGSVRINTYATTVRITIPVSIDDFKPATDDSIRFTVSGGAQPLLIKTNGTSVFTIDWGDGIISDATGSESGWYQHSFPNSNGIYTLTISNCDNINSINFDKSTLYALWSIGNSKISNLSFNSYSNLRVAGADVFKNDGLRTNFSSVFYNCRNLRQIPVGLFDGCREANNFKLAFTYCVLVPEIPVGLFDDCTKAQSFDSAFSSCTLVKSIPESLFASCPAATSFNSCFNGCSSIEEIPAGLFRNNTLAVNFTYCFSGLRAITTIPEGLFANNKEFQQGAYLFYDCYELKSVPSGLFTGCSKIKNLTSLFGICIALTHVPADLLTDCVALESFRHGFSGCTNLQTISESLFRNCTNITDLYGLFSSSGITTVPEGLFDTLSELSNVGMLFQNCDKLESLPNGLFRNNPKITYLDQVFLDCVNLQTIPGDLFEGLPDLVRLTMTFFNCNNLTAIPESLFATNTKLEILNNAFINCYSLKTLPANLFAQNNNLTDLNASFSGCKGLETIPAGLFAGKSLVTNFYGIFSGCSKLKTVASDIFSGCESVTQFGYAFNNTALEEIPDGLFADCPNIKNLEMAFNECISLKAFRKEAFRDVAENAKTDYLCTYSSALEYAEIPPSFTHLGYRMFASCSNLSYVETFTETPPVMGGQVFNDTNTCPIYVPDSAVDTYKQASGWTEYANRIFPKSQKTS